MKYIACLLVLASVLLCLPPVQAFGAEYRPVTGFIYDDEEAPISGALVSVAYRGNHTVINTATSDVVGRYAFNSGDSVNNLPENTELTITASHDGFSAHEDATVGEIGVVTDIVIFDIQISGTVYDVDGNNVPYADISISYYVTGAIIYNMTCDRDGQYDVPMGSLPAPLSVNTLIRVTAWKDTASGYEGKAIDFITIVDIIIYEPEVLVDNLPHIFTVTVQNIAEEPLPGVTVTANTESNLTGPDGVVSFSFLDGQINVEAVKSGYRTQSTYTFVDGIDTGLIITLMKGQVGCGAGTIMMISPLAILAVFFIFVKRFGL
jgi:hypothetical protein